MRRTTSRTQPLTAKTTHLAQSSRAGHSNRNLLLELLLGLHSASPGGVSVGWIFALALVLVVANSAAPANTPLFDEIVRVLMAEREALSGAVIVQL